MQFISNEQKRSKTVGTETGAGAGRKWPNNLRAKRHQTFTLSQVGLMLSVSENDLFHGTKCPFSTQLDQTESDEPVAGLLHLHDTGMNYVQTEFRILLNLFLPFGLSPLTFEPHHDNADDNDDPTKKSRKRRGQFGWRWRSQRTVLATLFSILSVLLTILFQDMEMRPEHWLTDPASELSSKKSVLRNLFRSNNTKKNEPISLHANKTPNVWKDVALNRDLGFLVEFATFMLPVSWLIGVGCGWLKAEELGIYLNNWSTFQDKYFASLQTRTSPTAFAVRIYRGITKELKLCGGRRYLIRRVHFWTIVIITSLSLITVGIHVIADVISFKPVLWIATRVVLGCRLIVLGLLVDAQDYFMYNHVIHAFRMIRLDIHEFTVSNSSPNDVPLTLTFSRVIQWHDLIKMVRRQCHLLSKYQKPTQLFYLLRLIILETILLFIVTSTKYGRDTPTNLLITVLGFGLFIICLLLQLWVKCVKAEQITIEEARMIEELSIVAVVMPDDQRTIDTIRFLCLSTLHKPSCVNLGNYFVLNRKLLLAIISQTIVYLIVLKQFNTF